MPSGGLSPSGLSVNTLKYTVTNTDILNAIVISDFAYLVMGNIQFLSNPTFNGVLVIESKNEDGSYSPVATCNGDGINPQSITDSLNWGKNGIAGSSSASVFPFKFRVRVSNPCTLGNCVITINYV